MHIRINAKPTFALKPSMRMVELLLTMSEYHYDGVCKSMSKPALNGEPNGLFVIWKNEVTFALNTPNYEYWCYASLRELDLVLKVCENSGVVNSMEDRDLVVLFCRQIHAALRLANEQIRNLEWMIP